MNLVRAIFEPLPAPVIVETPPQVVEKTVVVERTPAVVTAPVVTQPVVTAPVVTTTQTVVTGVPKTVIVTGAEEFTIPEYSYVLYEDEYIPYYEGWLYLADEWRWADAGPRPARPPRWTPPPRPRHEPPPPKHKVIVLPDHRPAPGFGPPPVHRPVVPPAVRREEKRPEPPRTVVVRPERREAVPARPGRRETVTVTPGRKDKEKVTPGRRDNEKNKEKVTVPPERRKETPPKKGR